MPERAVPVMSTQMIRVFAYQGAIVHKCQLKRRYQCTNCLTEFVSTHILAVMITRKHGKSHKKQRNQRSMGKEKCTV